VKVQDLARKLGKKPKDFIKFLTEVDIKVKSGNTRLDDATVKIIEELFEEKESPEESKPKEKQAEFVLTNSNLTVGELAKKIDTPLSELMRCFLEKGLMLNLNSQIDQETSIQIAEALGIKLSFDIPEAEKPGQMIRERMEKIEVEESKKAKGTGKKRPPIVTIMGHVDHGKTQLLDVIRNTRVVEKEAGGITQHIGAYQVQINDHTITFLDTPGHEAFTSLRARGAQVTDIAILVVAADEGVKPQTIEAIHHAKAAKLPIIVALNKIDKPEANVEQCKQQLSQEDLLAEDWGGKIVMVPVSAKENKGIDDLLETIVLEADILELKADKDRPAKAVVIEASLSKQKGPLATVLVKSGTLRVGDHFAAGPVFGKVRALFNDQGKPKSDALPGSPAEILGCAKVPLPGDILEVYPSEKEAREEAETNAEVRGSFSASSLRAVSLETLSQQIEEGDIRKLNIIVKGDVHGSVEAIMASVEQIPTKEVSIYILHSGTGPVTENDIMLAKASDAIVVSFNVALTKEAQETAETEGVSVRQYTIIYEIINDIKKAVEGLFKVEYEDVEVASVEVREIFSSSKVGKIAGCMVKSGNVVRNATAEVMRGDESVHKGKISSLKRFKEDVKEVASGYECGIVIEGFNNLNKGDIIICYKTVEKKRAL